MGFKFKLGLGDVTRVQGIELVKTIPGGKVGPKEAEGKADQIRIGENQVDPQTVKESESSKPTFHSTLFENFRLNAEATYNYYVDGETESYTADVSASLDQLPRYVTLTWRVAPRRSVLMQSDKGVKPFLTAPPPPRPVASFDVIKTSAANGYVAPGTVTTLVTPPTAVIAPPRLDEDAFLVDPKAGGELASMHVSSQDSPYTLMEDVAATPIRVRFVDPSIAGALDRNRLAVATEDIHLTVVGSFSKILSGLEVISEFNQDVKVKNPPPTFPAPPEAAVLSYVGYLIERYDVSPDGSMRLGRTISIDNIDSGYYVDREVVYGMRYAYKIRSVVQWVHPPTYGFDGRSTVDRQLPADRAFGTKVASYYYGDWSDWSRTEVLDTVLPEPPDEILVQPYSRKGLIRIVWKMPNDPQRDINSLHVVKAVVKDGTVSDWTDLGVFPPGNGALDDRDVRPFDESGEEYIYSVYSTSVHGQVSPLGEQVQVRTVTTRSPHEHPLVRTAAPGADPTVHPTLGDPRESTEVVATKRIIVFCRGGDSVHPLRDKDYLLDVRSLSTGERVRVNLNVDSSEILLEAPAMTKTGTVKRSSLTSISTLNLDLTTLPKDA